jgi:hypothetical protein
MAMLCNASGTMRDELDGVLLLLVFVSSLNLVVEGSLCGTSQPCLGPLAKLGLLPLTQPQWPIGRLPDDDICMEESIIYARLGRLAAFDKRSDRHRIERGQGCIPLIPEDAPNGINRFTCNSTPACAFFLNQGM